MNFVTSKFRGLSEAFAESYVSFGFSDAGRLVLQWTKGSFNLLTLLGLEIETILCGVFSIDFAITSDRTGYARVVYWFPTPPTSSHLLFVPVCLLLQYSSFDWMTGTSASAYAVRLYTL